MLHLLRQLVALGLGVLETPLETPHVGEQALPQLVRETSIGTCLVELRARPAERFGERRRIRSLRGHAPVNRAAGVLSRRSGT